MLLHEKIRQNYYVKLSPYSVKLLPFIVKCAHFKVIGESIQRRFNLNETQMMRLVPIKAPADQ